MPGREMHTSIGTVVGALTAAARTPAEASGVPIPELGGGAIGGYWGSRFPDLIEPASSPWHRDVAHSAIMGGILASSFGQLGRWEIHCRRQAAHHREQGLHPGAEPQSTIWHTLAEWFWRLLAGLAAGLLSGYISHLVLDGFTRQGLPLLGR